MASVIVIETESYLSDKKKYQLTQNEVESIRVKLARDPEWGIYDSEASVFLLDWRSDLIIAYKIEAGSECGYEEAEQVVFLFGIAKKPDIEKDVKKKGKPIFRIGIGYLIKLIYENWPL